MVSQNWVFLLQKERVDYIYFCDEINIYFWVFYKDLKNNVVIFLLVFESLNIVIFWISFILNDKYF